MRKIFRFFAIAATVAAAASCAKELAPAEGAESNVELIPYTIEASLPETKATLNNQQVVWQEGDKIAVFDGTAKQEFILTAGAGTKTATFRGEVTATATKISATYPYSAAGDALGKYTIPAVQNIAAGATVDPAALVMEAAAVNKGKALSFKNACGVARMTVPAGTKTVTFGATGSLSTIKFAQTPAEEATVDMVLPAQDYKDILVALTTDEGSFVKASDSTLTIKRSYILNLGNVKGEPATLITTGAELKTFLESWPKLNAYICQDLDLTGIALTDTATISGVFDGRGCSIKNWTAAPSGSGLHNGSGALVWINTGKVKNIVIDKSCVLTQIGVGNTSSIVLENRGTVSDCTNNADMNLVDITGTSNFGVIVAKQTTNSTAKIERCVNNGNYVFPEGGINLGAQILWGGIVGRLDAGTIENCINNGNLSITAKNSSKTLYFGGIVGFFDNADAAGVAVINNCRNNGNVVVTGKLSKVSVIGGIAASTKSHNRANSEAWVNYGTVKGCRNDAEVGQEVEGTGYSNVGGIIGYAECDIDDCHNGSKSKVYNIHLSADNRTGVAVAGIAGRSLYSVRNCSNEGSVLLKGCFAAGTSSGAAFIGESGMQAPLIAGICGSAGNSTSECVIENCTNSSSDISADITMKASGATGLYTGCITGYTFASVKNCTNTGNYTIDKCHDQTIRVAGIAGYAKAEVSECKNTGDIKVSGIDPSATQCVNASLQFYVGGIVGQGATASSISDSYNSGNIAVSKVRDTTKCSYAGGIAGQQSGTVSNCKNEGECSFNSNSYFRVGGICAHCETSIANSHNYGDIKVSNATCRTDGDIYRSAFGGVVGHAGCDIKGCSNYGKIICTECADSTATGLVAGTVGNTAKVWDGNIVMGEIAASNVKCCGYLLGGHLSIDPAKEAETITTKVGYTTPNKLYAAAAINGVNAKATDCADKTKLAGYLQADCEAYFDVAEGGVTFEDYGPNFVAFKEAANCFVVKPGAIAMFPTFKGEGGAKADIDAVELGWQDEKGLYAGTVQIADGSAIVKFADGKEGNALLLGKKAGVVVWSWHFWVASEGFNEVTIGDFTFLDRNVGATSLSEKTDKSFGVIYQYGRKDPYPCMKYGKYSESVLYGLKDIYDEQGGSVTINIKDTEGTNNLENSIKNPTTFYRCYHVLGCKHNYNWITTDIASFGKENFKALWENDGKKSSYDPCPAGYKVASVAAWNAVKTQTVTEIWDNEYETFDSSVIGNYAKWIPGMKKKVQFRGCDYGGLRFTVNGQVNALTAQNTPNFNYDCCIGKAMPTAIVWCADFDPEFDGTTSTYSNLRGTTAKVNTGGNGNYDDISAIKANALNTSAKYNLTYALPVRCIKEK